MRTVYEAMIRHLHSGLDRMKVTEEAINSPQDPTSLRIWEGYVTFEYDPWEPLAQTESGSHHVMATTYSMKVTEVSGVYQFELILLADASKVREDYTYRAFKVSAARTEWDAGWNELDTLLNGQFHAEQPSLTWLAELYPAEPDHPENR